MAGFDSGIGPVVATFSDNFMSKAHESLLNLAKLVFIGGPIVLVLVAVAPAVIDHLIASYRDKRR